LEVELPSPWEWASESRHARRMLAQLEGLVEVEDVGELS
jgi:hypothetical protein